MKQDWDLIWEMALSDFKLRYKGSKLGFLWSFLKPLLMLAVLYTIFSFVIKQSVSNYLLFLLLGIILWNFFVEATTISMSNILAKREPIKAIYFPRTSLVISSCVNASFTLAFNMLLFLIVMAIMGVGLGAHALWFIIYAVLLFALSLGFAYLLSALYVRYNDVSHIWEVLLQAGFWATPIVYSIQSVPRKLLPIYAVNPLSAIINGARDSLIYALPFDIISTAIAAAMTIVIYIIGYAAYRKMSPYFAEYI